MNGETTMILLLTAFDPFGGETINPALDAMNLVRSEIGDIQIVKLEIPTVFGAALDTLLQSIRTHQPDAVLCLGQAGGREDITPERVAINLEDASLPDNQGQQPADRPVVPGGPAAYFSTLPIKAMAQAMLEENISASVSNTAGTFVCNHLMYGLLHALHTQYPQTIGGFMHVPFTPQQAARHGQTTPSLPLADIVRGIEICVRVIGETAG